jgi:deoxyribodipyrimidine photo-lyase
MQAGLIALGSSIEVYYGFPEDIFKLLFKKYSIAAVYANHDYESYALERDAAIETLLKVNAAAFYTYKDQVIFEKKEVVKDDDSPYSIFTPYSRKWKAALKENHFEAYEAEKFYTFFLKQQAQQIPTLKSMGFKATGDVFPSKQLSKELVKKYTLNRDYPSLNGTSKLGIHLRFGTISIRQLVKQVIPLNETFLNELIWRDFYHMILWNFPHVGKGKAFKKEYDWIKWRNNEDEFEKWCQGKTGYPIVDAGMRELNKTGYMHNRVRMIVASFLTKHLLIDWRWGEAYFASKLLDFDLAANNGGWQWASGSGCDAAPYFRIFSPARQTDKFDKELKYIRHWVPELDSFDYPKPMVEHEFARKRCLETYAAALKKNG